MFIRKEGTAKQSKRKSRYKNLEDYGQVNEALEGVGEVKINFKFLQQTEWQLQDVSIKVTQYFKKTSLEMHCIISMFPGTTTLLTRYMSTPFLSLYLVLKEMYHQGTQLFLFENQTTQYYTAAF